MKIVKCRKTTLKTPLTSSATSVKLDGLIDSKGVSVALSSFGAWFVIVVKQGELTEMIKCDGLTQNVDGSATCDVATNGRGLNPTYPYAGSATGEDFSTGAEVIVTNDPLTMAEFARLNDANTFTGTNTFTESAMPRISAPHTYAGGEEEYFATKGYVDGVAIAGAPDASTTSKGIVEIQTQAEYESGATTGGTTAPVVPPAGQGARFFAGYAEDAGGDDTYAITLAPVPTSYFTGMIISFKVATANTGACTINANALGAKALKLNGADPESDYIQANSTIVAVYDGTNFNIIANTLAVASTSSLVPTGAIFPYALRTAPAGYLLAVGTAVSRTTYSALFDAIVPTIGTPTISNASPAVVSLTSHGLAIGDAIYFTTTGGLPTGLSINTLYYIITAGFGANSFQISATRGGTAINTSSAGSGTHTMKYCPYGLGDGTTTFNLPNLAGKVPVGISADTEFLNLGLAGGEKTHTLIVGEMPSHTHTNPEVTSGSGDGRRLFYSQNSIGATTSSLLGNTGGDGAHNNIQPYNTTSYIIKT